MIIFFKFWLSCIDFFNLEFKCVYFVFYIYFITCIEFIDIVFFDLIYQIIISKICLLLFFWGYPRVQASDFVFDNVEFIWKDWEKRENLVIRVWKGVKILRERWGSSYWGRFEKVLGRCSDVERRMRIELLESFWNIGEKKSRLPVNESRKTAFLLKWWRRRESNPRPVVAW